MQKTITAAAVTMMLALPVMANADTASSTASDVQSQIQALMAQIETLKAKLMELTKGKNMMGGMMGVMGSTTPMMNGQRPCPAMREFKNGERSEEVKAFQKEMKEQGFMSAQPTGFFGSLSQKAMNLFKTKRPDCGQGNGMMGGDVLMGTTTAANANVVSILTKNGETKSFAIASTTKVDMNVAGGQPTAGAIGDVTVGEFVGIRFKKETDGSMTAMLIMRGIPQIAPRPMGDSHGGNRGPNRY